MSFVCAFLHTDIAKHGGCCAEVEVKQSSPIADHCVPATENRRHMPAEYMGLQLRQSKKLTVVGCRPITQHAVVRLHHGIPHGITMVRPRGNTTW